MVKKRKEIVKASATLLSFVLMFNGLWLDLFDFYFNISEPAWNHTIFISKDALILGISILGTLYVPYKNIHIKTLLFLFTIWRFSVLIINMFCIDRQCSLYTLYFLDIIYITWCLRVLFMRKIKHKEPTKHESFYILTPINSIMGLLQAIFLPWHPARYETRMISDGKHVWFVGHGAYQRKPIELLNIDKTEHIKVVLKRPLSTLERARLNRLIGQKAIAGIKDCRRLMVVGRV